MYKKHKGFTLIDVLVSVSIISLLSSIVLANVNEARAKARNVERREIVRQYINALELYREENGGYPIPTEYPSTIGACSTLIDYASICLGDHESDLCGATHPDFPPDSGALEYQSLNQAIGAHYPSLPVHEEVVPHALIPYGYIGPVYEAHFSIGGYQPGKLPEEFIIFWAEEGKTSCAFNATVNYHGGTNSTSCTFFSTKPLSTGCT